MSFLVEPTLKTRWFYYFTVLAEEQTISAAARKLEISAQALNQNLVACEKALGAKLVERQGKGIVLTAQGKWFLETAREMRQQIQNTQMLFQNRQSDSERQPLTLGYNGFFGSAIVPRLLPDLRLRFPQVFPRIYSSVPSEIEKALAVGRLDLGLLSTHPTRQDLSYLAGKPVPYVIVSRPQPRCHWQDLTYIRQSPSLLIYSKVLPSWNEQRYPRRVLIETDVVPHMLRLCQEQGLAMYVPLLFAQPWIDQGVLAIVADPPEEATVCAYLIWNARFPLSEAAEALKASLQEKL